MSPTGSSDRAEEWGWHLAQRLWLHSTKVNEQCITWFRNRCHHRSRNFTSCCDIRDLIFVQIKNHQNSSLGHLSGLSFCEKLSDCSYSVTALRHLFQSFPPCSLPQTILLWFWLPTHPYIYFNPFQFYLVDTLAPSWNDSLFSLTHDLFFIFWRSSGASNLSALPKISPSSLTNNHNSSFNSRK